MCGTLLVIIHLYEVTGWLSATLQDDRQAVWFTCHYYNPVTWALLWRGSINVLIVDSIKALCPEKLFSGKSQT